jgi:hypothetical protein
MKRYMKVLVLFASAVLIFIGGAYFGSMHTAERLNKHFTLVLLPSSAASELKAKITLLELLNSGDSVTAQKRLETFVDLDLGIIALYVNNPPLTPDSDIVDAIKLAKKYREKHPEHHINPISENSVRKTLDFVKDK